MAEAEPSLLFILPFLLLCCLMSMLMRGRQGQRALQAPQETDAWFSPQKIDDVFKATCKEIGGWRRLVENEPRRGFSFPLFGGGAEEEERFRVVQSTPPRLYRVMDRKEGETVFELVEIEGNGTFIKVSYHLPAKNRIQTFKARSPARIPATWHSCPSCTKPILLDFVTCPYCGQKLKAEAK